MSYALQLQDHYAGVRERLYAPRKQIALQIVPAIPAPPVPEPESPSSVADCVNMLTPGSWRFLLAVAALKYGVSIADILSVSRSRTIIPARQEAMALIFQHTQRSAAEVGRLLNRDHSTVLYALDKQGVTDRLGDATEKVGAAHRPRSSQRRPKQRARSPKSKLDWSV